MASLIDELKLVQQRIAEGKTGDAIYEGTSFRPGTGSIAGDIWRDAKDFVRDTTNDLGITSPPPPNVADTEAAKRQAEYAQRLAAAQGSLPTPTYGTAPQVVTGTRPTAPGQDVYARAAQQQVTSAAGTPYADTARASSALAGSGLGQRNIFNQPITPEQAATAAVGAVFGGSGVANTGGNLRQNLYGNGTGDLGYASRANADIAAAQKQIADYEQSAAAWDQIYGGQAQQSGARATATQISAPQLDYRFGMAAPQSTAPQLQGGAPQVYADQLTGGYGVRAPGAINAQQVTAQQIAQQQMTAPKDIATEGAMRDAQLRALGLYEGAANGTAPSAAEALMRKGIDENIGAQLGMAATLQGNTPGLALRAGLAGAQGAVARSSADMAALRADEQERGRAGFLQAATGIRAQDIAIAQSNQTKDLTTAATNLQARIDVLKSNQQAALQAGMSNQAANLQAQIQNANNQLEAAKATASNSLSRDIANMTASLDARKANQAAQVSQNLANLSAQMEITKANLNSALQTGLAGEAARLQADLARMQAQQEAQWRNQQALLQEAQINAQIEQANAAARQQQQQFTASAALAAQEANQRAGLAQQQLNNNLYLGMTGAASNAMNAGIGVAQNDIGNTIANNQGNQAATQALLAGTITTGGSLLTNIFAPKAAAPSGLNFTAPRDPDDIYRLSF